ncbi:hypothetical protein [Sphingobium sp.]|uniref:hypothetical protein n=2 Tax=Sphingobium sp. TaxID=1912891 RepID=UPI00257F0EF4|nr:hypothetical protein [Sphingobium sp.]
MIMRARLVNAWRRLFPHPVAIARRDRERAAMEGRIKRDRAIRRAALQKFGKN